MNQVVGWTSLTELGFLVVVLIALGLVDENTSFEAAVRTMIALGWDLQGSQFWRQVNVPVVLVGPVVVDQLE